MNTHFFCEWGEDSLLECQDNDLIVSAEDDLKDLDAITIRVIKMLRSNRQTMGKLIKFGPDYFR
jgi:hypothetical protein